MCRLTIDVIKTIQDRKNFKEVLIDVASGLAVCGFFKCTNWKEILESIFNPNLFAPETFQDNAVPSDNEKINFSQTLNISEIAKLINTDWNLDSDQILNRNLSPSNYVESKQIDESVFNKIDIETSIQFDSAAKNNNKQSNENHRTNIEENIPPTPQFVTSTSTVQACKESNIKTEMIFQQLPITTHMGLDPQTDAIISPVQRILSAENPIDILSSSSLNATDTPVSQSSIIIIQDPKVDDESNMNSNMQKDDKSDKKKFACEICYKTFCTKKWLKRHIEKVHDQRLYPLASQNGNSILTTKRRSDEQYVCDACQRVFRQRSNLKRHQMIHLDQKPYACDVCQRVFNQRATLKIHQETHKDDRQLSCAHCTKSYKSRRYFNIHLSKCYTNHNFQDRLEKH